MAKHFPIRRLVVHCSATPPSMDIGVETIRGWHRAKGWADVGYHYVIRRDGTVEKGRHETRPGAHVAGFNTGSLGICLVGGVREDNVNAANANFTAEQLGALRRLLHELKERHPGAAIMGHRDLSPDRNGNGRIDKGEWVKDCPAFNVTAWWLSGGIFAGVLPQ